MPIAGSERSKPVGHADSGPSVLADDVDLEPYADGDVLMRVDGEPATRREPDEFPIAVVTAEHAVPNVEPVGLRARVQFVVFIGDLVPPFRVAVLKTCARTRECVGSRTSPSANDVRQVEPPDRMLFGPYPL